MFLQGRDLRKYLCKCDFYSIFFLVEHILVPKHFYYFLCVCLLFFSDAELHLLSDYGSEAAREL